MPDLKRISIRLTVRDRQILEFVDRYRVVQHAPLRRALFPKQHETGTIKILSRLCREGFLQRVPLLHRQCYFTLTPHTARLLGVSEKRTGPLGVQSLPCELAVLHLVSLSKADRIRLTAAEITQAFPWMERSWTKAIHCQEQQANGSPILELIRVALGGKPDHVARKCFTDIDRRRRTDGFQSLLKEQRFRLIVIVATREAADAIRHALQNHLWPEGLQIQLKVLQQLLPLLGGLKHAP